MASLLCESSHVSSSDLNMRSSCQNFSTWMISLCVGLLMCIQAPLKGPITLWTCGSQFSSLFESLLQNHNWEANLIGALEWPFSVISCLFMLPGCEKLLSHFVHFIVFSPVNHLVSPHVTCQWEAPATLWATEWHFSCVSPLRSFQVTSLWEALLLCESSNVPSSDLPVRSSCHT